MLDLNLKNVNAVAMIMRSIQHDVRKNIVAVIDGASGITVKEIKWILQLEQSVTSAHLSILRQSGIVRMQREGRSVCYFIDDNIKPISSLINQLATYFK
ncbi:MAG TPA: ArsR family transcriptional regulator [Chitinophagales bacterium]|nr:ArsR family transcriptional regulator [Chitinophagales bacterium]